MSEQRKVVHVRCTFGPGDFPTDRKFSIEGYGQSTSDENYCFAIDRKTRLGVMDSSRKRPSEGYVLGLLIGQTPDGKSRIQCPDGDIYELDDDRFVLAESAHSGEANA